MTAVIETGKNNGLGTNIQKDIGPGFEKVRTFEMTCNKMVRLRPRRS